MRISEGTREAGFTLIELLAVVAIIAFLTAFAVPRVIKAVDDSRYVVGKGDMHTIEAALERYRLDNLNDGNYPAPKVGEDAEDQVDNDDIAACRKAAESKDSVERAKLKDCKDIYWFTLELKDYLRPDTRFSNGYYTKQLVVGNGKGYIYISDAEGSYYILVDPGQASSVDIGCLGWTEFPVSGEFEAIYAPKPANLANCTPPVGGWLITN